mgnify:CR=1 FL=1
MSFFAPEKFTEETIESLKTELTDKAIIAASGGVDSTIAAVLASRAVGDNLLAIYVDTGYMRLNESEFVSSMLQDLGVKHKVIDASKQFYEGLQGVIDPEKKRKIIGELFIRVFEEEARKYGHNCRRGKCFNPVARRGLANGYARARWSGQIIRWMHQKWILR